MSRVTPAYKWLEIREARCMSEGSRQRALQLKVTATKGKLYGKVKYFHFTLIFYPEQTLLGRP
jgi:hypothetical protein